MSVRDKALMVPEESVVPGTDGQSVYRVSQGKARKVVVVVGVRQDGMVEIVDGLKLGDQVVSAGQIKLRGPEPAVKVLNAGSRNPVESVGSAGSRG